MADDVNNQNQGGPAEEPTRDEPESLGAEGGVSGGDEASGGEQEGSGRERRERGPRGRGGRRPERVAVEGDVDESVVKVYRCATVVKGGRRFSFAAMVVVGDRRGRVGIGYGKANEVPNAVEKAGKAARRAMVAIPLQGTTVPHRVLGKFGASRVQVIPAGEGTGVIAGDSVRTVMELAGVKNVLTKAYGSTSPKNLVKAAFNALVSLRSRDHVARLREVAI